MLERFLNKKNTRHPKNGKWKEFNKQAILVAEGNYQHDLKHGLWKQYYETGELLIEEMYDKGILHGRYASYHINGKLLSEGEYMNGNREGFFHIYDERGLHVKSILFTKNMLVQEVEQVPVSSFRLTVG